MVRRFEGVRWCPECGDEYLPGVMTCSECFVPLVDEKPAIVDQSAPAEVGYELDDWTDAQRDDLTAVLTGINIRHFWEGTTLVVFEDAEAEAEDIIAELTIANRFTAEGAPSDSIVHPVDGLEIGADVGALFAAAVAAEAGGAGIGPAQVEGTSDQDVNADTDDGYDEADEEETWVEVDVEIAWHGRRLIGGLIDAAVLLVPVVLVGPIRNNATFILMVTAAYAIVSVAGFGRTPGMVIAGTKVVDGEALLPTWGAATWRWLVPAAAGLAAGVLPAEWAWSRDARIGAAAAAVVVVLAPILLNGDRRGLHDTAADTYVVLQPTRGVADEDYDADEDDAVDGEDVADDEDVAEEQPAPSSDEDVPHEEPAPPPEDD